MSMLHVLFVAYLVIGAIAFGLLAGWSWEAGGCIEKFTKHEFGTPYGALLLLLLWPLVVAVLVWRSVSREEE